MAKGSLCTVIMWGLACVILAGCGSHAPTLPSPDGGGPADRTISGILQVEDFVVAAGERVACEGDVTVECATAIVEGELFARPTLSPGADGSSITIQATGDVLVSGVVTAASGVAGGSDGDGGAGGDLTITSTEGDVNIGAGPGAAQLVPAQAAAAQLQAGNGADGGDGYHGGAGGAGGTLTISAPDGTLTINERPGLLGVGDGGNGGQGAIFGDDMLTREPTEEPTNNGGDSGQLLLGGQNVAGVPFEDTGEMVDGLPCWVIRLDPRTTVGGVGGDGGDGFYGVDPRTGEAVGPSATLRARTGLSPAEDAPTYRGVAWGGQGGNGGTTGGRGGDATANGILDAKAMGGDGGYANYWIARFRKNANVADPGTRFVSGGGGNARAVAGRGSDGDYASPGRDGHAAEAIGGEGGRVNAPKEEVSADRIEGGRGGDAFARGGDGGNGGPGCNPPLVPGGRGGAGGQAKAVGGKGGYHLPDHGLGYNIWGAGGNAEAIGGNGGNGGQGWGGGAAGAGARATAEAGYGQPGGWASERNGTAGVPGNLCPGGNQVRYSVLVRPSAGAVNNIHRNAYVVTPMQLAPDATITGAPANQGQTLQMSADLSRLWIASGSSVFLFTNAADGAAAPDFGLTPVGGPAGRIFSIWLDETRDLLYASTEAGLHVWENASGLNGNTPPTRTVTIIGWELWSMTGDPQGNRLFASGFNPQQGRQVLVFDDVSELRDVAAPNRRMQGITGSEAIACDPARDLLYTSNGAGFRRIENASQVEGQVASVAVEGPATGFERNAAALALFPDTNVLFVQEYGGPLRIYENASEVAGNVAPNTSHDVGTAAWPIAMTGWAERG